MKLLVAGAVIAICVSSVLAGQMPADNIHGLISGVYELEEWHVTGAALKPPQVEGRFILLNGTITTILHNRTAPERQTTTVFVGKYVLDKAHFSYGYRDASNFVETATGASASHKPPWDGMRSFATIVTPAGIQLRAEGGQQEFAFTKVGFTYSENGQTLRVWRRIAED